MPIQSAEELLVHELRDIEDAEKQASQALERMMKEVEHDQLRSMLERRMQEGQRVLEAVQSGIEKLDGKGRGTRNEAARGLIEEAQKLLKEVKTPEMKQAVMIAGTQKLEHYCIAAWGTVKAIAREMGEQELVDAMQQAIDEGYAWDREMTELAESGINPEAMMSGEMETAEEEDEGEEEGGRQGGRKTQSAKGGSGGSAKGGSGGKSGGKGGGAEGGGQGGGGKSQSASSSSSGGAKKSGGSGKSGGSQGGGKSQNAGGSSKSQGAKGGSSRGGGGQDSSDLKSREYRDSEGNVHHHTREYMERQGK